MHGQCRMSIRTKKPCDPLYLVLCCATESSAFFLTTPRSYAAIAFYCGQYEKLLRYGKRSRTRWLRLMFQDPS
jgi:hypothetical protein